jgi:hypothetical protein
LRDQRKFLEASSLVRRALQLVPDAPAALALQRDIEKRRSQPERTGPSPEELARARQAQEAAVQAKQAEDQQKAQVLARDVLSRSLISYTAGDADAALEQLAQLLAPASGLPEDDPLRQQASSRAELIRRARQHHQAAQDATRENRAAAATAEWKSLLEVDRALLGQNQSSQYRQQASRPLAETLTREGDALYTAGKADGDLAAAYAKYREALAWAPGHTPARAKLEAIEEEAVELYRLAYGRWEVEPQAALIQIQKVLKMLPSDHEYSRRAQLLAEKIQGR